MSAESIELNEQLPISGTEYAALTDRVDVDVTAMPNAAVCGAMGCRNDEYLVRVRIRQNRPRVVCPTHAQKLLRRELGER